MLVETSCVSTTRPGRTSAESQNTNGPRLCRAPYTTTNPPPPPADSPAVEQQQGLAGKFYRNLQFLIKHEKMY